MGTPCLASFARREGVIAVGWDCIEVDPSKVTDAELRAALKENSDEDESRSATKIRKFVDLEVDDIVLLASALGKETLLETIHSLGKTNFDYLAEKLKELGVHGEV